MGIVSTVAGVALIAIALHDVFQTLLRPGGTGRLTHTMFRVAWAASRGRPWAGAVGSLAIVVVICLWIGLIGVGWALVYLPHLPDGFTYTGGVSPEPFHPFAEALNISFVALTTLGYGDVIPVHEVLRLLTPLESLMGFALLSAAVSWFTQLYPALARRRALALRLRSDRDAGTLSRISALDPAHAISLVRSIGTSLTDSIADLAQNSELYYFTERDPRMSMPLAAADLLVLRDAAAGSEHEGVRAEGRALAALIDDLARVLRQRYPHVRGETTDAVLRGAAMHHGHDIDGFPTADPPR